MAAKRLPVAITTTVGDAVSTCYDELKALGEEMRERYDNTPENLQGGDVASRVEEAADALEGIEEPEIPEDLRDTPVSFTALPLKARASRADRCAEAVRYAQEAIDALQALPPTDEIEAAVEGIQTMVDDAEAVEFPGMFG